MSKIAAFIISVVFFAGLSVPAIANDRALSPDGRWSARLIDTGKSNDDGTGTQSLILTDRRTGLAQVLLTSRHDDDWMRNLAHLDDPIFSLDGGYLYITSSDGSPNLSAIHQISLRTGAVRSVGSGSALKLIRTGPYRGYLLVQDHRYFPRFEDGSYNPVSVVRPDGHVEFTVPGSKNDDGELAVDPWLKKKGWKAW